MHNEGWFSVIEFYAFSMIMFQVGLFSMKCLLYTDILCFVLKTYFLVFYVYISYGCGLGMKMPSQSGNSILWSVSNCRCNERRNRQEKLADSTFSGYICISAMYIGILVKVRHTNCIIMHRNSNTNWTYDSGSLFFVDINHKT